MMWECVGEDLQEHSRGRFKRDEGFKEEWSIIMRPREGCRNRSNPYPPDQHLEPFVVWHSTVYEFSKRNLTKGQDKLPDVSGDGTFSREEGRPHAYCGTLEGESTLLPLMASLP
jgi:hypothetical protein